MRGELLQGKVLVTGTRYMRQGEGNRVPEWSDGRGKEVVGTLGREATAVVYY